MDSKKKENSSKSENPVDSKIGVCHYHLCRKRTKVYRCKYCGEYFCEEHIKPKPPGMPKFNSVSQEDVLYMEEWRDTHGHPCAPFYDYWITQIKKKREKYMKNLDKLLKAREIKKKETVEEYREERNFLSRTGSVFRKSESTNVIKKSKKKSKLRQIIRFIGYVLLLIIILSILSSIL